MSPRPFGVIQRCSAALEACVPLATPRTTHCFIANDESCQKVSVADFPSLTQNLMFAERDVFPW